MAGWGGMEITPQYDVGVHGATLAGVAAALELKRQGLKVWLSTHRNYLGEDLCDPLRLVLPVGMDTSDPVLNALFPPETVAHGYFRPMALKAALDALLLEAKIPVFAASMPGELYVDEAGRVCGISLCNRSGRKFVGCRRLLDATVQGDLLRLAGVRLSSVQPKVKVIRRVIGGEAPSEAGWQAEAEVSWQGSGGTLWAHHSELDLAGPEWGDWMDLEQRARIAAYRRGQVFSADGIDAFSGETLAEAGAHTVLDNSLWVLGSAANMPEEQRALLKRPDAAYYHGVAMACEAAKDMPAAQPENTLRPLCTARVGEHVVARDLNSGTAGLLSAAGEVAAIGHCDVLVVGGGTGGAPAGLGAARSGAKTIVAEFLSGLGGVGTLGLIGRYWFGVREGFTAEVDAGANELTTRSYKPGSWDVEAKMQWYHQKLTEAGAHIWYKTAVAGALRVEDRVVGAILATPRGRIAVLAKCTVDATGSAEVAAAAGARTVPVGDGHLAMQGTGLPARNPGLDYGNTDYEFVDDSSAEDHASAHVAARKKFNKAFDSGQLVDSRERRRIVGDIEVSPMDIRLSRVFPDTICRASSNFDTHGFTIHPLFMLVPPGHDPIDAHIPLRCLLPQGLDGVLVTGLGISAHRDAMPVIRMQADVQNQGFAAGMIAARSGDKAIRALDLTALQRDLLKLGILTPDLVAPQDSFPLPEAAVDEALAQSVEQPDLLDRWFTLPRAQRTAKLHQALHSATDERSRRHFAFVAGILGDPIGVECLAAEVAETPWDKGWNYTGMGQFGASMSPLDARIIALGRCRVVSTLPILIAKARALPEDAEFSHYRALTEAFSTLGDAQAADVLGELLARPGIRGHEMTNIEDRLASVTDSTVETSFRNKALIEISLAAALFAVAPASQDAKAVLTAYSKDLRGLFANYAAQVLYP